MWDLTGEFCTETGGNSQGSYIKNFTLQDVSSCGFS